MTLMTPPSTSPRLRGLRDGEERPYSLSGAHQHVTLAAGREFERARRIEVALADPRRVGCDRLVVQPRATALDQLASLGAAFRQAGLVKEFERRDAGGKPCPRHIDGGQRVGLAAF